MIDEVLSSSEKESKFGYRFLVTSELNRLARWLRLLGFDTVTTQSNKPRNWGRICQVQNRILLTRTRKSVTIGKNVRQHIVIKSEDYLQQLRQVFTQLKISELTILSRCLDCNRKVYPISKEKIVHLLPPKVQQGQDEFTYCRKCGKIYWKGTHYQAMMYKLSQADILTHNKNSG